MSQKRLPTPSQDAGNWETILNEHIAQTKNPLNGAFNSFDQFSSRPTNLTADDAGRTYLCTQTGNWHEWSGTEWKVQNKSEINVKDYGAVGNGVADDTAAIQAAINSIAIVAGTVVTGDGSIHIPAGNYKVSGEIIVPISVKIIGAGKEVTKVIHSDNNICFNNSFEGMAYASTEFRDFTLYHTYTNNPNAIGILTSGSGYGVYFKNLNVQGFNGGVGVELRNINNYWTESTHWDNVAIIENKIGVKFSIQGGTDSFGYTNMKEVLFVVAAGQIGVYFGTGTNMYNSHFSIRANLSPDSTLIKLKDCNTLDNYYEFFTEGLETPTANYTMIDLDNASMSGTGYIPNHRIVKTANSRIYMNLGNFGEQVGIGSPNPMAQLDVVGKDGIFVGGYNNRGSLVLRAATGGANFGIQNSETNPNQPNGAIRMGFVGGTGISSSDIPEDSTALSIIYGAQSKIGINTSIPKSALHVVGILEYPNNSAAISAGLSPGAFYRTGEVLKIVY